MTIAVRKIILLAVALLKGFFLYSQSQGKLNISTFEKAHQYGIPGVYDMFQDSQGIIWFGSTNGVYRYNGTDILEFKGEEKKNLGKTNYSFLQEKDGNILIGSDYGICRYRYKENKIELLIRIERSFDERSKYYVIGYDKQDFLWLAISGIGVGRYKDSLQLIKDKTNTTYFFPDRLKQGYIDVEQNLVYLTNYQTGSVIIDTRSLEIKNLFQPSFSSIQKYHDMLFLIYPNRITVKNRGNQTEKSFSIPESITKKTGTLYNKAIVHDDSCLWISGMNGIFSFNFKRNYFESPFGFGSDTKSTELKLISELFKDEFGNVWICSETNGIKFLNEFKQKRFQFVNGAGHTNLTVMDIEPINDSLILICPLVSTPRLINTLNNSTVRVFTSELQKGETYKVDKLNDSICLLSSAGNTAYLFNKNTLKMRVTYCSDKTISFMKILVTEPNSGFLVSYGQIFKFTFSKNIIQLHKSVNVSHVYNSTLLYDPLHHYLIFSNHESSTFIHDSEFYVLKTTKPLLGAFNDYVFQKSDKSLWLGTRQGLKHYDVNYNLLEKYSTDNGLNNDVIYALEFNADSSRLFMSTNMGISELIIKTKKTINHTINDGVQESEHNTGAGSRNEHDFIYFGNISGVTFFNASATPSTPQKPFVVINYITVNDTDYRRQKHPQFLDTLVLNPDGNNLSLHFTLVQTSQPEKLRYEYLLEGVDSKWKTNTTPPTIHYSGLNPGNYTLRIRGCLDEQCAEKKIKIIVLPPFYKTWWFLVLLTVSGIALIALLISLITKARIRRNEKKLETERKLHEQKTQISRDLHDNVGARLSMMLNTMDWMNKTKIFDDAIVSELHDSTKSVIQNLRETIWVMNKNEITSIELFDKVKTYTLQFFKHVDTQVNFNENIEIETIIHSEQALNLFRIAQEVLNNTMKYANANSIDITIRSTLETYFEIIFSDNGKGFDMTNYVAGNGIINMKERANDMNADILINSSVGKGTRVCIKLYSK